MSDVADESQPATADLGVLTVDRALVIRTWSSWLETATGMAASDVRGRPLADVVPDLQARGLLERFQRVLETGEAQVLAPAFHHYLVPCATRVPSDNFTQMQQRVTLGPLRTGDTVAGVMATVEDVTVRIDAERRLAIELRSADPAVRQSAAERLAAADLLHAPAAFTEVLRQGDWQVRRTAVQGMTRHASKDLLASLFAALRNEHHDFNVLNSALQLLSMIEVDITAPLAELLEEGDPDVRIQAALALGSHPGPAATAALVTALSDSDANVRFHAIEALGRLRVPEAAAPLAVIAESGDFFLAFAAIDALVRIADPRVAQGLLPLLHDARLAAPVAEALGALGGGEVVRPLVRVLDSPSAPVGAVARAIATLYATYDERYGGGDYIVEEFQAALSAAGSQQMLDALQDGSKGDLRNLVLLLGWVKSPVVERALTRLLGHPDVRADVIEALVRQGGSVVGVLVEQLRAPDDDVRHAAVTALQRLGDARATLPLCELLVEDPALVIAAAGALARIGSPQAFEPLVRLLGHGDPGVRQAVIGALNSLGHPEMAGRVLVLLGSSDAATRESAVRIAGYFGYPECADPLFLACADSEESVRRAALEHALLLDAGRALPVLVRAARSDTPRGRASAAIALGRIVSDDARIALHGALLDADVWVRYFAARALGQHRDPDSLDPLATMASGDPAPHARIAALGAIGEIDGPRAAGLLARALDDPTSEVVVAALAALGHVRDPAGLSILREALRSTEKVRRVAAVQALGVRGAAESVDALSWTAGADAEEDVRAAAFEGLARLAAATSGAWGEAVDALVDAAADPERREIAIATLARASAVHLDRVARGLNHSAPDVRRAVVDVLTRSKHFDAAVHLRGALDDKDPGVREAAIIALDRVGAPGVSSKLAVMAAGDPDATVRRTAGAVLSREPDREGDRGSRA